MQDGNITCDNYEETFGKLSLKIIQNHLTCQASNELLKLARFRHYSNSLKYADEDSEDRCLRLPAKTVKMKMIRPLRARAQLSNKNPASFFLRIIIFSLSKLSGS